VKARTSSAIPRDRSLVIDRNLVLLSSPTKKQVRYCYNEYLGQTVSLSNGRSDGAASYVNYIYSSYTPPSSPREKIVGMIMESKDNFGETSAVRSIIVVVAAEI